MSTFLLSLSSPLRPQLLPANPKAAAQYNYAYVFTPSMLRHTPYKMGVSVFIEHSSNSSFH